jgi:hypothetical protein
MPPQASLSRSKTGTYFVALANSMIINAGISPTSICARNFLALQLTFIGSFLPWHGFGELLNQKRPEAVVLRVRIGAVFRGEEMLSQMIERLKKYWHRRISLLMVLAGSALLSGCAALGVDQSEQPVMVSEVIRMSEENVPAETIVNKMRDSRAVYRLNAAQLVQLHDQGVADLVLNYMQDTYLNAVRREQDQADWSTREMWRDHFW